MQLLTLTTMCHVVVITSQQVLWTWRHSLSLSTRHHCSHVSGTSTSSIRSGQGRRHPPGVRQRRPGPPWGCTGGRLDLRRQTTPRCAPPFQLDPSTSPRGRPQSIAGQLRSPVDFSTPTISTTMTSATMTSSWWDTASGWWAYRPMAASLNNWNDVCLALRPSKVYILFKYILDYAKIVFSRSLNAIII